MPDYQQHHTAEIAHPQTQSQATGVDITAVATAVVKLLQGSTRGEEGNWGPSQP